MTKIKTELDFGFGLAVA